MSSAEGPARRCRVEHRSAGPPRVLGELVGVFAHFTTLAPFLARLPAGAEGELVLVDAATGAVTARRFLRRPPQRVSYPNPWTAREAAKDLVRSAIEKGQTPEEFQAGGYGISRPDDNAVVGKGFGANPRREIAPDQIGVTGFDPLHKGEGFPRRERWEEVSGEQTPQQVTLFDL